MATLYVENVPDDLYEALRDRARMNRKSIAAEVVEMLRENVPTPADLARRQAALRRAARLRALPGRGGMDVVPAEELLRQDRGR